MYIPVIHHNLYTDLSEIKQEITRIEKEMPRKTPFQEEIENLRETVMKQDNTIKELLCKARSLESLNEKLIEYIDNIEGVKQHGGVEICFKPHYDAIECKPMQVKMITIPEFRVAVLESM